MTHAYFPGTICHKLTRHRYPNKRTGEDSDFSCYFDRHIVLDNDPSMYIRTWHGFNCWSQTHTTWSDRTDAIKQPEEITLMINTHEHRYSYK